MNLLLLTNVFPTAEEPHRAAFVDARVKAMRAIGAVVDVVAVGAIPTRAPISVRPDYVDATVPVSAVSRVRLRRGANDRLRAKAVARVLHAVNIQDYDAVAAHGMFALGAGHVAWDLSRLSGMPFSVHLHGSDVNVVMPRAPQSFLPTLGAAERAVFVSGALLRSAIRQGYDGANALVIPNGVDLHAFSPLLRERARIEFGVLSTESVVCFVGNLLPVKGADRLPKIFRILRKRVPGVRFLVLGDGPLRSRIEEQTACLPVNFLGRVSPEIVARAMAAADALIVPSRSEGWPCVIHEAYASATPVVGTNVGGIIEAIADPRLAVAEGPGVEDRLAWALETALEANDRESLPVRAADHTWTRVAQQELEILGWTG